MAPTENTTRPSGRVRELLVVLLLVFAALYVGSNFLSAVRFDREQIDVWAFERQTQVTGLYHYVNRSFLPVSFSLSLPFPIDADHKAPALFSVSEVDVRGDFLKEIATRDYHGTTVFRVWFLPSQEKWVRVDYVQGTRVNNARYILLTTRKWRAPLDHGDYILHLGQGLELDSSSYLLSPNSSGAANTYSFVRTDFLPSADWQFSWRVSYPPNISGKGQP